MSNKYEKIEDLSIFEEVPEYKNESYNILGYKIPKNGKTNYELDKENSKPIESNTSKEQDISRNKQSKIYFSKEWKF